MPNILSVDSYSSPIGPIWIVSRPEGLLQVVLSPISREALIRNVRADQGPAEFMQGGKINQMFLEELDAYFSGSLRVFKSRFLLQGTPFQRRVWQALFSIPYGSVKTYAEVAAMIGQPKAYRAVGSANRENPLPLLIPCHRVVGTQGLGGYSPGIATKQWLLNHEAGNRNKS